jgi:hypothetical protein
MQTLQRRVDVVVHDADRNVLALVEVKNRQGLSPEVAASFRRNLMTHGIVYGWSRFFLIVSQDTGFLWDQMSLPPGDGSAPTAAFPMASVVRHYLPSFADGAWLSGSQLELAVVQWLWDLARDAESRPREPEAALGETEFLRLIKGGRVDTEIEI